MVDIDELMYAYREVYRQGVLKRVPASTFNTKPCGTVHRCPKQNKQMSHRDKIMDGEKVHEAERNKTELMVVGKSLTRF